MVKVWLQCPRMCFYWMPALTDMIRSTVQIWCAWGSGNNILHGHPLLLGWGHSRSPSLCGTRQWARPKESSIFPLFNDLKFQGTSEGVELTPVPPEDWACFLSHIQILTSERWIWRLKFKYTRHLGLSALFGGGAVRLPCRAEHSSAPWDFAPCCIRLGWISALHWLCETSSLRHRDTGIPGCPLHAGVLMDSCPEWCQHNLLHYSAPQVPHSPELHTAGSGLALNTGWSISVA